MYQTEDTIVAVASPPGPAARGIVRLSGELAIECARRIFRGTGANETHPPPIPLERPSAFEGVLRLEAFHSPVPAQVYVWPGRRSYTGQPVAEFHTVGSPPVLDAIVRELCRAGARPAEPGEFTLRAFLSGRIDLTQAEAVLGTIDATNRQQLDAALAQLAGGLSRPLAALRTALLDVSAHLEAGFDFADEDLPFITAEELESRIRDCAEAVDRLIGQIGTRHETVNLPNVVLCGPPNAGKSSLFNALVGDAGALVSRVPGTTRDYLTATLELGDLSCRLVDTAGMRPADGDAIESAAQAQMEDQKRSADLLLYCVDASAGVENTILVEYMKEPEGGILVLTKCDKVSAAPPGAEATVLQAVRTSSKTGQGLLDLKKRIREVLLSKSGTGEGLVVGTAVRCGESLRLMAESLHRALARLTERIPQEELIAADLRLTLEELGKIVGLVYTEDLLNRVFSRFCVGK